MRYVPARRLQFIDDVFKDFDERFNYAPVMKTDISEKDGSYRFEIELPGFTKEEIFIELSQGNLLVQAEKAEVNEVTDNQGKIIRRERSSGKYARKFYIGDGYSEKDISAQYENGILVLTLKALSEEEKENKKIIAIE